VWTMRLKRYDRITLDRSKAIRLDNGMMRVPARLSRIGIQDYYTADGKVERAYRPIEEVGAAESVASFDLVPLTNNHPMGGEVTADNSKHLTVGMVGSPKFNGQFVEASLLISDKDAVRAVESGKLELSCGYYVERDDTPGEYEGQHYDFVQRNIRGNHVAIVDSGRAGPDVRIMLDSAFSTDFQMPISAKEPTMKLTIDGHELEVTELVAASVTKERTLSEGLLNTAKAEVAKLTATVDAANEKVAKLEQELKDAPAKLQAALVERAAVEAQAKILNPEIKCDGLDLLEIKRAALVPVCDATIKLAEKDANYINTAFEIRVADAAKKNPATEAAEAELKARTTKTEDSTPSAKEKMFATFFNPNKDK
jgi:uncharacterized protein